MDRTQAFLSPTARHTVDTLMGPCDGAATAAALFCGWGAEIHLLLQRPLLKVMAVDQLQGLLTLLSDQLATQAERRVDFYPMDAMAFLLMAPPRLDIITALGGGPSYVGQGAFLASAREKLRPGGFVLVGDLVASGSDRRRQASELFGVQLPYLLTVEGYEKLITHAGFTVADKHMSSQKDWADYFARMESYSGMDTYPFNNPEFAEQLQKEKTNMLIDDPPAGYVTWRLEPKSKP